jgi:hypothetical protein
MKTNSFARFPPRLSASRGTESMLHDFNSVEEVQGILGIIA